MNTRTYWFPISCSAALAYLRQGCQIPKVAFSIGTPLEGIFWGIWTHFQEWSQYTDISWSGQIYIDYRYDIDLIEHKKLLQSISNRVWMKKLWQELTEFQFPWKPFDVTKSREARRWKRDYIDYKMSATASSRNATRASKNSFQGLFCLIIKELKSVLSFPKFGINISFP